MIPRGFVPAGVSGCRLFSCRVDAVHGLAWLSLLVLLLLLLLVVVVLPSVLLWLLLLLM